MKFRAQTLVCLAFCLVGFFAGWWVNGLRSDSIIAKQEQSWSDAIAWASKQAMDRYESMEKTKDEAIKAAQERATKAEADAGRAAATADSLRKQVSGMPARIATASRAAVDEYAATAGELLVSCTSEYQWMARKADEHANSERTLMDAWPR